MPTDPIPSEFTIASARHIGRRVICFDELASTNDYVATLAKDPSNAGIVVVAAHQSHGRGQHGRVWQSRPGASLLLSTLVYPPSRMRRPVILTAWAVVAIADAIYEVTGIEAKIKWPNDVLVFDKKICGVLIEQGHGTIVGVGLNLNQTPIDFIASDLPDATSLSVVAGQRINNEGVLHTLLRHLDEGYDRLATNCLHTLEEDWVRRIGLLPGHKVRLELTEGSTALGHLLKLGFDGVSIESESSSAQHYIPERVRRVRLVT